MTSEPRVGLFGEPADLQVQAVAAGVEAAGGIPFLVDLSAFPSRGTLHLEIPMDGREPSIRYQGTELLECGAFYVRSLGYFWPVPTREVSAEEWAQWHGRFYDFLTVERERLSTIHSVHRILGEERFVVNPYESYAYHDFKPYQWDLLERAGLPVPEFLASNDPAALERFYEEAKGEVVAKPGSGGEEVKKADPAAWRGQTILARRPILLQRFVPGENYRAYVVGDEVVAALRIHHGPQVDSRVEVLRLECVRLPAPAEEIAVRTARALSMRFSGVDLQRHVEEDRFYVLEANPSPMFVFQEFDGSEVARALGRYLVRGARGEPPA
ncbi:MAG: hypothetical protein HY720_24995 [Planctomycetes bacterium]|nr:hypothetical protein [Planctomycetota bacterium]